MSSEKFGGPIFLSANSRTTCSYASLGSVPIVPPPFSLSETEYSAINRPAHFHAFLDLDHGDQGLGDAHRQSAVASPRDSPDPPFCTSARHPSPSRASSMTILVLNSV